MSIARLTTEEVLALIPQQRPFRFIDRLLEISDTQVVGEYSFRPDESFYAGHFPGDPVTPGAILLETMCQTGVVALGIYLLGREVATSSPGTVTLFTSAQVEFEKVVRPGETVRVEAAVVYWRMRKLKSNVRLSRLGPAGERELVAHGTVAGIGVPRERPR